MSLPDTQALNNPSVFSANPLTAPKTIAFVDANIFDANTVLAGIQADVKVLLDPTQDGIAQITKTLKDYKDLAGIDIISHGNAAELQLGNNFLDANSLKQRAHELQQWGTSLSSEADILFYGCNVAAGEAGQNFVKDISKLTGADVAASTNLTGNSSQGGDWTLESATGKIEMATPFTFSLMSTYQGVLDTIFTPATAPSQTNLTDGVSYELGLKFTTAKAGQIESIRYWKASSETGAHVGRIWSSTGQQLASVAFTNETASGWQEQALATPISISANTTYTVSVNTNGFFAATTNNLTNPITNGNITALANGGVYGNLNASPVQSINGSNYFRDIVFTPAAGSNTLGTVNLSGSATQGSVLSATVSDTDGLAGSTIAYQWQQSSNNGTTWSAIAGATAQNLTLTNSLVNSQVRVNATYTDALGTSENIFSPATAAITGSSTILESLFAPTVTPPVTNVTDGVPYELGVKLTSAKAGQIQSIRYWKAPSETGTHVGKIWSSTGTLLASVTFSGETASGWQQQDLATPLNITANTVYTVAVNSNFFALASNGLATAITNGDITALAGGGVYGSAGAVPSQSLNSNYFRDIVFTPAAGSNTLGTVNLSGSATQGSVLSATVSDTDGLAGSTIAYQWQQSSNNGTTWSAIAGATAQNLTLTNSLVNSQVRVNATYTDALGTSENIFSPATAAITGSSTILESLFAPTVTPPVTNVTDGVPYELGVKLTSAKAGQIQSIRYWKAPSETGTHVGKIWSSTGTLLASVTFSGETASGWQQQDLATPLNITANTVYTVAVNSNFFALASNGLATAITNGDITALAGGGVYGSAGAVPSQSLNSNYFRDIVFTPAAGSNTLGTVNLSGSATQGSVLSATVSDTDGLAGSTIAYQWQQSSNNGTTWSAIAGATAQNLTLTNSLVNSQVRVNATYTDALGTSENIFSPATAAITGSSTILESLFAPTVTPPVTNVTDGVPYELGVKLTSAKAGQIQSIRYWKAPSETGTHVGKIWSSTGTLLASVTFSGETASGWQQQDLATPLNITANTVYTVVVNSNFFALASNGLATAITNGDITALAGGGVYGSAGAVPSQSLNSNYFRDIVFTPTINPNNVPGTVTINGTVTQNQTLSAAVADADGLTGVTIGYQWQQSSDNGTTWTNIAGATAQTLTLGNAQASKLVRVQASYTDVLNTSETIFSSATSAVGNVNDPGKSILRGSATVNHSLTAGIFDDDGLTGVSINYQWQQFVNNTWQSIAGATAQTLTLTNALLGLQVRALANYIDALGTSETVSSAGASVAAQNAIVLENQKAGTTAWKIASPNQATNEIVGYGDATSINKGQAINLKVSLAQAGQYNLDVYRLGYYGGAGGHLVTSVNGLNGLVQAGPTITPSTKLTEYKWNNSYTLQTDANWTSGLYFAKLTDSQGKQNYIQFVVRDDDRPADIGFQDAIATAEAYNNYGGTSVYDFNSSGGRAYQVSFDRPFQYGASLASEQFNNTLSWEYNMTRWMESQGYDVSYYTNLDVSTNSSLLYSQKTFLTAGHDEYWSMQERNNVEKARDNGINLAFFSANTGYWQVRFDTSTSGQANRVMTVYKDSSGLGTNSSLDPIAQTNPTAATTLFRSPQVNRPENALLGVGYTGDTGGDFYGGFDYVVSNASDPYYANTGLQNGDRLSKLVGYEWDSLLNNGLAPAGLVALSQSPVPSSGLAGLGLIPSGTNDTLSNAVRYTASSGAKVFSTGSVQWVWGLDSDGVTNPREDNRVKQIAVNVLADMGAKPQTPSSGVVVT